jgi:hypothetical protein
MNHPSLKRRRAGRRQVEVAAVVIEKGFWLTAESFNRLSNSIHEGFPDSDGSLHLIPAST